MPLDDIQNPLDDFHQLDLSLVLINGEAVVDYYSRNKNLTCPCFLDFWSPVAALICGCGCTRILQKYKTKIETFVNKSSTSKTCKFGKSGKSMYRLRILICIYCSFSFLFLFSFLHLFNDFQIFVYFIVTDFGKKADTDKWCRSV